MHARNESLHHLPGEDFQTGVLGDFMKFNTHAIANSEY
jgi:hypothetical protein